MAKAKNGGWYKESLRHSQARRFGKAKSNSNLTYMQLKAKGVNLKPNADSDGDGVKNSKDCRPLNKYAQDDGMPASNITVTTTEAPSKEPETKETTVTTTTSDVKPKKTFKERLTEASDYAKLEFSKAKASYKKYNKEERKKNVNRIEKELEEEEDLDEDDRARIEDLDLHELSDKELKILAIREGESLFGGNQYEAELERRIREEARIETDRRIIINEEKIEAERRIREANNQKKEPSIFGDLF